MGRNRAAHTGKASPRTPVMTTQSTRKVSARTRRRAAPAANRRRTPVAAGAPSKRSSYSMLPPTTFSPEAARALDRSFNAWVGKYTMGADPRIVPMVALDWLVKLAWSPGTHARLSEKACRKAVRLGVFAAQALVDTDPAPAIEPLPQDHRFDDPAWKRWPYSVMSQAFLLRQQWWANATTGVPALSEQRKRIMDFTVRQLLDISSPSNFLLTNPEVRDATLRERGANLRRGWSNWWEDWHRLLAGQAPAGTDEFRPGRDVAVTPGKVVYRNRLIELIQYAPTTQKVQAEPILFVPAWIMKYYILDLTPERSLVRYLVDQGHTVFMISWRNPTGEDRDLRLDDYRQLGVVAALDAIARILPERQVHAVGYCLGGTLLAIAAAAMERNGASRLKTVTLLAAQTDFSEAGELMLFINEEQVSFLESMMWNSGVLESSRMAGAFQLLRSNDLIWSRMVKDYLLGRRRPPDALTAWNADQTRMPYRMHSEYLREILLNNRLARGEYRVDGRPIAVGDIKCPIFAVGTVSDHVAPWQSVYKINLLADAKEVTFLLTSGGHNAGILSEPGHPRRSYQMATRHESDSFVDAAAWQAATPRRDGSWWPAWQAWLAGHSSGQAKPPPMGAPRRGRRPLAEAPGTYVFQR
jgi:polyhydroxyalkanoate synthase